MGGGNGRRLTSRRRPPRSPLTPPPPGRPAPDTSIIITRHGSGGDPVWVTCLPQLPSQKNSIIMCHHQDQHYHQLQQPPLNQAGCPSPTPPIWPSPSPVTWGRRDMIWPCIWWRKGEWMEVACMTYPRSVSDDFWVPYDVFSLMGERQREPKLPIFLTFCHFLPRWLNSIQNHLCSLKLPKPAMTSRLIRPSPSITGPPRPSGPSRPFWPLSPPKPSQGPSDVPDFLDVSNLRNFVNLWQAYNRVILLRYLAFLLCSM